ncbi:hypothetical protein LEN26_011760 [Aphanomyces euteiches]|nr:hypothetical protein AeMF1_018751 [Aphanomyces euteiches]KAH9119195.1 hypothetical protein LEN26_011760 [Aphanomyces euteiches]
MFRTGDYGRLLPNGRFEVHGRKDSQVKLKEYRIELEEVGEAMMRHPHVTAAAALVKDKTHLVGYFTPPSVDVEELRALVASYVPVYMVPAVWVPLESMPQNVNGKTDRLALEAMDVVVVADALKTEEEVKMAQVWSQVLDVDISEIGANSSFFALGGDSISGLRLVAKAKQTGLYLTTTLVMKHSTLRGMVNVSKVVDTAGAEKIQIVPGRFPLTPIQHFSFEHSWKNVNFWNLSMTLKPRLSLGRGNLENAIAQLVSHHDMLRARYSFTAEGDEGKEFKFAVMLEGHGREAWTSDIDVSTTVGWFTCEFPVVFTDLSDLGDLLLQVKQRLRAVPDKGLSYAAIKYLAPQSESTQKVKAHRPHNIVFNYLGRFQECTQKMGYLTL